MLGRESKKQQQQPIVDMEKIRRNSSGLTDVSPGIIDALRKGDHKAFEYVYLHYSRSLTQLLTALTQAKEDAQEITQEVFITLWNKREILDPEKGLRRYLYQLAKYRAFDLFDHRRVRENH